MSKSLIEHSSLFILMGMKKIDNIKKQQHTFSRLDKLRVNTIRIFNIFFILFLTPPVFIALSQGEMVPVVIGFSTIFFLSLSTFLIFNGKFRLPVIISCCVIPPLGFLLTFTGAVPFSAMFAELCLMLGIFSLIIDKKAFRYTYFGCYLLALFILYYQYHSLADTIGTLLIISGFAYVFQYFAIFLERQDNSLSKSLADQKSMNDKLQELNLSLVNKSKELQTFSHIMGHDLKAPLRSIRSFSGLISRKLSFENEDEKQYFEFITNSTKQMQTLIDDLLLFHKVESAKIEFEAISLNKIIRFVYSTYHYDLEAGNVIIESEDLPVILGNIVLLKALFNNLISNSIKYQPIDQKEHQPQIRIWSTENQSGNIELFISDNGIGIEQDYLVNLFEPFKKFHAETEYKGSGLGMSICKRVMEKHNGKIELLKTSTQGTIFKLTFLKNPTNNQQTAFQQEQLVHFIS